MGRGAHRPFGVILDDLCLHPPRGRAYSNAELVRAVKKLGGAVTASYLVLLRSGTRDNPTLEILEYLAAALDVSPAVFVGGRRSRQGAEQPRLSFSRKLNHLFAVVYETGRGPRTPEMVAQAITAKGAYGSISPSYIRELLAPPADTLPNPRLKHVLGLAEQFGLSRDGNPHAAYFLDDELAAAIDSELADLAALRDAGVVEFVTRLAEHAPNWRPELRRQVVDAFTQALDGAGDTDWVSRAPGTTPGGRPPA
jgi:hypothetical protein